VVAVNDVPQPAPAAGEVVLRVSAAGLCHSDVTVTQFPGWPLVPMTLGHEIVGTVAELGAGVTGFAVGDAVLVYLVWSCGACRTCLEGRENVCVTNGFRIGMPPCPGLGPNSGGMAEYVSVPARYLEQIGDLDPVRTVPMADAGLTTMHAVNTARARLTPGATAVVIGVGGLGHVAVQILRQTTASRVIAIDTDEGKLAAAAARGADVTLRSDASTAESVLELTGGYGADVVLEIVGAQATVDLAGQIVAPDGALRLLGVGDGVLDYRPITVGGTLPWGVDVRRPYAGTRNDLRQAIDLLRSGRIETDVTTYPLERANDAFTDLDAGRVTGRAVLIP
jgi:propanol-preferring alcohol dehydrogenase